MIKAMTLTHHFHILLSPRIIASVLEFSNRSEHKKKIFKETGFFFFIEAAVRMYQVQSPTKQFIITHKQKPYIGNLSACSSLYNSIITYILHLVRSKYWERKKNRRRKIFTKKKNSIRTENERTEEKQTNEKRGWWLRKKIKWNMYTVNK